MSEEEPSEPWARPGGHEITSDDDNREDPESDAPGEDEGGEPELEAE